MWAMILGFVKTKLFSLNYVFIGILVLFAFFFIGPASDAVLSRLGFETKSSLKGDLVAAKKDVGIVVDANKTMQSGLTIMQENHKSAIQEVQTNKEVKEEVAKKVEAVVVKKKVKVKPAVKKLEETTHVTTETVILNKEALEQVSEANITSLNETFDSLFPEQPKVKSTGSSVKAVALDTVSADVLS